MFESEERQIVERIKDFIKKKEPHKYYYIMLKNGRILSIKKYSDMVSDDKVNPQDAYVHIGIDWARYRSEFHYPFLIWNGDIPDVYLSKLGFYYGDDDVVPATGLKYMAGVEGYKGYLSIELVDLDTAVSNTNLRKIVVEVLGGKLVSGAEELTYFEYGKIHDMFRFQKLFAGYNFREAKTIIKDYYDEGDQSLIKEVARIAMDYDRIYNPYRVCYDMDSWKEVDCLSIR